MKYLDYNGLEKLIMLIKALFEPKLPVGKNGQILSKSDNGVQWIDNENRWTYV